MGPRPPKPLADEDAEASIPSGDGATRASEKSASECESRKVVASTENKKESPTVDAKASELEANVRGGGTHGGWRGRRGRHKHQKRRGHDEPNSHGPVWIQSLLEETKEVEDGLGVTDAEKKSRSNGTADGVEALLPDATAGGCRMESYSA